MLGATVRVKDRQWGDHLECSSCMFSGGQERFPGGSRLLNQDLNHKEDLVGKKRGGKHSLYKDSHAKDQEKGVFKKL